MDLVGFSGHGFCSVLIRSPSAPVSWRWFAVEVCNSFMMWECTERLFRKGRTWAIAVRRVHTEFGSFCPRRVGKFSSELWFAWNSPNRYCPSAFPSKLFLRDTASLSLWKKAVLSGVIRANRFARFARIGWFSRIGNSNDSCESAWRATKIGVSIANDSRESIRANRVANRPCH